MEWTPQCALTKECQTVHAAPQNDAMRFQLLSPIGGLTNQRMGLIFSIFFLTCGLHSDSCAYLSIHQTGMFSLAIDQNSPFFFHYQSLKIFYRSSLSC